MINEECYTDYDQCRDDQTANVGTSMSRVSISILSLLLILQTRFLM